MGPQAVSSKAGALVRNGGGSVLDAAVAHLHAALAASDAARGAIVVAPREAALIGAIVGRDGTATALDAQHAPLGLCMAVARSGRSAVLAGADAFAPFVADPYFARSGPRSAVCLALVHEAEPLGSLYLEDVAAPAAAAIEPWLPAIAASLHTARRCDALADVEERAAQLALATRDAIYDWDIVSNTVWRNEAYQRLYSPDEPIGRDETWWEEHIHPDDRERIVANMRQLFGSGERVWSGAYRFRRQDGTYADVVDRGYVTYDGHGAPRRMIGAISDETERRSAEAKLRESEARVRRLLESNLIGIFFADTEGGISDANDTFLRTLGYDRHDLIEGRVRWTELTPREHAAATEEARRQILTSGTCPPYEKEYLHKDGTRVPVLVGATVLESPAPHESSKRHTVGFVLDLTERKRAEVEGQRRLEAEASNRAKSEFIARMSHELRTPLNAILGYTQLLLWDAGLTARQRDNLATIQRSGEHLLQLIVDLLDLSRIEAGKVELQPQAVELAALVREVVEIGRMRAMSNGLAFHCVAPAGLPAVHLDALRLRQVLLNLLANAINYTPQGQVELRVTPHGAAEGSAVVTFEVVDTGIGIAADQLERIFLPFEQVSGAQRRAPGAGIGLAISSQIVRLMGADLHVESRPGSGSRFWFELTLPLVATPEAAAGLRTFAGYRGRRRSILVVDDEAANRALLVEALAERGFEVREAASGEEALASAELEPPDLVLMDIAMPGIDGLDATRLMRERPRLQSLPVIVVSASASNRDRASSLDAGADDFHSKPVDLPALLQRIADLLALEVDE